MLSTKIRRLPARLRRAPKKLSRQARAGVRRQLARRGDTFSCPCCDRSAGRLLPYEHLTAQQCPYCGSFPRHRFLWLWLRDSGRLEGAPRMLHIAPERALERRLRPAMAEYVSIDVRPGADVQGDITKQTPFDAGWFDLVVCSHVLEHVDDDRAAMRELRRLTAPGGVTLVMVPTRDQPTIEDPSITDPKERWRRFGQWDHVRYYGPDIVDRLADASFTVETVTPSGDFERLGLAPGEPLFVCRPAG